MTSTYNQFRQEQAQNETTQTTDLLQVSSGPCSPNTDSFLQDLLEICGQPSFSPDINLSATTASNISSSAASLDLDSFTHMNDLSTISLPLSSVDSGIGTSPSGSSDNSAYQNSFNWYHQDVNSPDSSTSTTAPPYVSNTVNNTTSATVNDHCNFSVPTTPQSCRGRDHFYSPIIPASVVPTSRGPQPPVKFPEYASYPTGGAPVGQPDLITSNPVIQAQPQLQQDLRAECRPGTVPLNLLQATLPPSGQFPTPQIPLSARSGMLQVALINLEKTHRTKAVELQRFYQLQSAKIVADRVSQLCTTRHLPSVLNIVNQYFDMQHHALIDNIDLQMHCLRYQFSVAVSSIQADACNNKENPGYQPTAYVYVSKAPKRKSGKPKPLNDAAVQIMTNWYERHIDHPYPSPSSVEMLAEAGGITPEQVKKWFANKRMRNANTKPQREQAAQRKHKLTADSSSTQQVCKKLRI